MTVVEVGLKSVKSEFLELIGKIFKFVIFFSFFG